MTAKPRRPVGTSAGRGLSAPASRALALAAVLLPVGLLCALPIGRLVVAGLMRGGEWDLAAAAELLSGRAALLATIRSLETSLASASIAVAAGAGCALLTTLWTFRFRKAFAFLFVLSMMVAPQVIALAFAGLSGPASPLLLALGAAPPPGTPNPLRSAGGIILVLGLHHAPLAFIVMRAGLVRVPRELLEAASVDGAGRAVILLRIVLPLLRRHLAAAGLLCFAAALGNFGIPAILGLPVGYLTLPTLIYRRFSSFGPEVIGDAATLALVLVVLAGTAVMLAHRFIPRSAELPSDGRGIDGFWKPGAAAGTAAVAAWTMIVLGFLLPFSSLAASAVVPSYGMPLAASTMTAEHFVEVLFRQDATIRAFRNSLVFAATAAGICAVSAALLAYLTVRLRPIWRSAVEAIVELPYAVPGVVLALAAILLLLRPLPFLGISLYGTSAIIILAYCARFLTLALKPAAAAMEQLDPAIEEAASLCGAGLFGRLRHIVLPEIAPSVLAGGLMVFLIAFNELTVSALLWSQGTETVGVVLFSLEEAGLASTASAVGVVAALVTAGTMLILDRLASRIPSAALPWR